MRLRALLAGGALVVLCGGAAVATSAATNTPGKPVASGEARHAVVPAGRPTIKVGTGHRAAKVAQYTIEDHGMPSTNSYSSSSPIGFNDNGQIFGIAARKAKSVPAVGHVDQSCLVWTGTRFVDLEPSLTITNCAPYAMNSADAATGSFGVVGYFTDIYGVDAAFSASVGASTNLKLVSYYEYQPSALYGINSKGVGAGYSFLVRTSGKQFSYPLFTTVAPNQMTPLQSPNCKFRTTPCLVPLQSIDRYQLQGEPIPQCAFGGCTINANGTVLGYYPDGTDYAVAQIGSAGPAKELFLIYAPYFHNVVVALNDAQQLLYFAQYYSDDTISAYIYDLASNTSLMLPQAPNTDCTLYLPIAMNNSGEVLGYARRCSPQHDFYWTWDAAHGTTDISPAIPANPYVITPLAINDSGQLLASLGTPTGVHWGILDPPAAPASHRAGVKGVRHAR